MRVAAPGKKDFRQWNYRRTRAARRAQVADLARSRRQNPSASKYLLQPDGGGAGKDEFMVRALAEGVVSGILRKDAAVVGLRSNDAGSCERVEREILALGTDQRIVALIADKGEARASHMRRQRKQAELGRGKIRSEIAGLHAPVVETVGDRGRAIGSKLADLLSQINFALQPLRGKCRDVEAVVIKDRVVKFQTLVVEKFGYLVADQSPLLQAPYVRLEGQGLVAAAHVE